MSKKIRVAVIYGGRSSEHSVSCVSAGAILSHLDPEKYEIIPIGITREGAWTLGKTKPEELSITDRHLPEVTLEDPNKELFLSVNPARRGELRFIDGTPYTTVDVIFPILHGKYGEDGTIQGLFELSGVPYVGTGVLSSAAAMDKVYTQKLLHDAGLPTSFGFSLGCGDVLTEEQKEQLGLPVFVKPSRGGSSIGVSKVENWDDFEQAARIAFEQDSVILVESENKGIEVECGVLQKTDGTIIAVPPAQLQGTDSGEEGFYGFDTKYLDDIVHALIPAPLEASLLEHIQELSIRAFQAINGNGLARVDFFITDTGPIINEINTMPGFTPISMYPQVFKAAGIGYADLLTELIDQALHTQR